MYMFSIRIASTIALWGVLLRELSLLLTVEYWEEFIHISMDNADIGHRGISVIAPNDSVK